MLWFPPYAMPFEGTAGTTDGPTTAGCFGAGRAGQLPAAEKSEKCRTPSVQALTTEGELGEF